MKILLHDYAGHAFTAQLARALAMLGHAVIYASFGAFETPKGRTGPAAGDPATFRAIDIGISAPFNKDNLLKRWGQQIEYAKNVRQLVLKERPDVVMSSNSPVEVQDSLINACHTVGAGFVFWVQDIHAEAIERVLVKKNRWLGEIAGRYYRRKEAKILTRSEAVIVISDAFREVFSSPRWGMDVSQMRVIENWATLDDIPLLARNNDWAKANLGARPRIIYSGTLARKHNPDLLLELARQCDADIYLFSQGSAAAYVGNRAKAEGLENLFVRPWVSVEDLPKMLASADILFAVIEDDAGVFSVPSKVLTYLAAGKPILASIPRENLSARNILREKAGFVSEPTDEAGLVANARALLANDDLRAQMGKNGRAFAERAFNIQKITAQFAAILENAASATENQNR